MAKEQQQAMQHGRNAAALHAHSQRLRDIATQLRRDSMYSLFLIAHGGKQLIMKTKNIRAPLHLAAANGDLPCVDAILKHPVDVEDRDDMQRTALHHTVAAGHTRSTQLLIKHGVDLHAKDYAGFTPLHTASTKAHLKCAIALLQARADVELCAHNGHTPVHVAAQSCWAEGIAVLCEAENASLGEAILDVIRRSWKQRGLILMAIKSRSTSKATIFLTWTWKSWDAPGGDIESQKAATNQQRSSRSEAAKSCARARGSRAHLRLQD